MGKKRHFKGNNASDAKRARKEKEDTWRSSRGDGNVKAELPMTNAKFENFYKAQHIAAAEEWEAMMTALRTPLPACFRINSDYAFADALRAQLHAFAGEKTVIDDKEVEGVAQLQWYPGGVAYKLGYDRRTIRKNDTLAGLHKWMVTHTESGNITRQEAVSMVPPLALDVAPHHRCLDMCAAPGSKTSQLLEAVQQSLGQPRQGVVVANDADTDRAYMLVHQCRRINSPLLVVTTHQGQLFPSIHDAAVDTSATSDASTVLRRRQQRTEYFDRVLCDVPCSGDGTLRKNPAIWGKWSTDSSLMLHPLQVSIAVRGFQLLRPGGLMVFSTCSLSPFEDEAVVAELLRRFRGSIELVDGRQFIPGFKARPGLSHWHVLNDFGVRGRAKREKRSAAREARAEEWVATHSAGNDTGNDHHSAAVTRDDTTPVPAVPGEEAQVYVEENATEAEQAEEQAEEAEDAGRVAGISDAALRAAVLSGMDYFPDVHSVPAFLQKKFRSSLFAPSAEEVEWMHLERCLRCLPHDEDTGGFFVATLRKLDSAEDGAKTNAAEEEEAIEDVVAEAQAIASSLTECEAKGDDEAVEADTPAPGSNKPAGQKRGNPGHGGGGGKGLVEFIPWVSDHFDKMREFYGFTEALTASSFYIRNEKAEAAKSIYYVPLSVQQLLAGDADGRLKVVALGVKVFERKDGAKGQPHDYRLLQEGMPSILPFITRRKIRAPVQDFCNMLGGGLVSFSTLSAPTVMALHNMPPGAFICTYTFQSADVLVDSSSSSTPSAVTAVSDEGGSSYVFSATCWRGNSRTVNVMCGKVDIERIRHQLEALRVLRPKVFSSHNPHTTTGKSSSSSDAKKDTVATEVEGEVVVSDDVTEKNVQGECEAVVEGSEIA